MGVSSYNITAATFDRERAQDYELSILTGVDSFAYTLRDRPRNALLAYFSHAFTSEEQLDWPRAVNRLIQADDKLRQLSFDSVVLGWETDRFTLVPAPLYDPAQRTGYLEQLTVIGLEDELRSEPFNELDAELIFVAPTDRLAAVERRLRTRRTHHVAGGLLTAWGQRSKRLGHASVSAALRGNRLLVAGHRNGKLLFFNTFTYAAAQDALYYLLLTYQQCGLSPARAPLYLCGEITPHSDIYRHFYRYVEDIRFCQYGAPPSTPPELAGLPAHLYFEFLCLG